MQNNNNLFQGLNFFKENLTLIIIGIYSISFANYHLFYSSFNINILSYVGINDLLFFTLEHFFKILIIFILIEILLFIIFAFIFTIWRNYTLIRRKGMLYLQSTKKNRKRLIGVFDKKLDGGYRDFRVSMAFILLFCVVFLPNKLLLMPTIMVYMFYSLGRYIKDKDITNFTLTFSISIVTLFLIANTLYNIYSKRFIKDEFEISFYENDKFISTEKKLMKYNYLGETSTHIFIYDLKLKKSKVIFKEAMTNYTINSNNDIDNVAQIIGDTIKEFFRDKK
ncbi:hypothetical protein MP477_09370 [Chryseobacterium sp. WG23]|uniref:hypothetical protein n=1 Tax=Chryseobacterium sp. WG23 TaxID=2926910 RepID=UPI00211E5608|nr:hypothetical protein [Chryseobacterium sp. WG23]MCQ9635160.1 hypothetical protein [Chryseobacterium sp. WG23]